MLLRAAVALLLAASPSRPPAFELRALGVLGGDADGNLSCYLLGLPGEAGTVLIDGGSLVPGVVRWRQAEGSLGAHPTPDEEARATSTVLASVQAVLLTHAHLDHMAGLMQSSTLEVGLAFGGKAPLPIVGLPAVTQAIGDHVFHAPLWADFTAIPPKNPSFTLAPLAPGATRSAGPFQVEDVAINHPVDCAAFFISYGKDTYLHLGDTGPTEAVWDKARPLLAGGALRAISLEVSFPSADEKLALSSGHLTPTLFLRELNKLAHAQSEVPVGPLTSAQIRALAQVLAPHFRDCPIIAAHIKAAKYAQVVSELHDLQAAGLNVVIPEQGERYRF